MTPMPTMIWSVPLLLGVCTCLIMNVSGQTTLRSSLQATNRMYVCPGENVTFVCSGVGDVINLYAPPYISFNLPLTYVRGLDAPGTIFVLPPIETNLTSTDSSLMVANGLVLNSSSLEFSIHCKMGSENAKVQQHRPSGPPLDVISPMIGFLFIPDEVNTATVGVNWTHNNNNYDLSHYTVQLFEDNTETESIAIPAESNTLVAIFSVYFSGTVDVHVRITVTSKCNETTKGTLTRTIQISGTGVITAYVFWVLLSAVGVVLALV